MMNMALARIRQLSAHEVGHTIGFAHNFSASAVGRASVMDYPHPTLTLKNGQVDFSNAYATGIGAWDKVTVAYSYGDVPANVDEKQALTAILKKASDTGLYFITDSDARAPSGAHSKAHLWDNGANASKELSDLLKLREKAIANFSKDNFRDYEPYSVLEDVFVPLYFYHRYQTEAAVKSVAGIDYTYASKEDAGAIHTVVSRKEQQKALDAILKTLDPTTLAIPEAQLKLFPPRAFGYGRSRESFKSKMGVAFDALSAAETASDMTLKLLLNPDRANRLIQQKAMDSKNLGLDEVLSQLVNTTFKTTKGDAYEQELQRTIQYVTLQHMINLVASERTIPQVRAIAGAQLQDISTKLSGRTTHFEVFLLKELNDFGKNPEKFKVHPVQKIPDGSPIGSGPCSVFND